MIEQPRPAVGQIWKEVDPRFNRHVRIEVCHQGSRRNIAIQTVSLGADGSWCKVRGSRLSYVDPERFNGKRGCYAIHTEDKQS